MGKGMAPTRKVINVEADYPIQVDPQLLTDKIDLTKLDEAQLDAIRELHEATAMELDRIETYWRKVALAWEGAESHHRRIANGVNYEKNSRKQRRRYKLELETMARSGSKSSLEGILTGAIKLPDDLPFEDIVFFTKSKRVVLLHGLDLGCPKEQSSGQNWRSGWRGGREKGVETIGEARKHWANNWGFATETMRYYSDFTTDREKVRIATARVEADSRGDSINQLLNISMIEVNLAQVAQAVVAHQTKNCDHNWS